MPTRGTRSLYTQDLLQALERSLADGDWPAAATIGNRLLAMSTRDPAALTAVAATFEMAEHYATAVELLVHAIALAPENANAWLNLGMIAGRGAAAPTPHLAALLAHTQGAYHNPTAILPAWGAATKFFALGYREEAEAWRREAAERYARYGDAPANRGVAPLFNLSFMLLALGQSMPELFPVAFEAYEARLRSAAHTLNDRATSRPPAGVPRWTDGRTTPARLAIFFEQGLGDTIMCARYAAALSAAGVAVVFEVQAPLVTLYRDRYPGVHVIGPDEPLPFAVDAYAWTMSLPGLLWAGPDAIPPDPLERRPSEGPPRYIAFAWRGSPANRGNAVKSCPPDTYRAAAAYARECGYTPIAVNRDEPLPDFLAPPPIALDTLADTAAVLEQCAAVVSICSSGAHLAGALQVPTLLVLSAEPDWRWGYSDPVLPWYGDAVTALRQRVVDDWSDVAVALPDALAALLSRTGTPS